MSRGRTSPPASSPGAADHLLTAHLIKVNKDLMLAARHAQEIADAALKELDVLAQSSKRDPLTGLPDRALFLDRLETAIAMAKRRGSRIAVLFVDLDNFKQINDQWGHQAGDDALKIAAQRLSSVVRSSDSVSRHGGDEFLLLLAEVIRPSDAELISAKILTTLAEPCSVGGRVIGLSASIGISVYPEDGQDAAGLISRADAAMYHAKRARSGGFALYREHLALEPGACEQGAREQMDAEGVHDRPVADSLVEDLRTPMLLIQTAADLLERSRDDAALVERLQAVIRRQAERISRVLSDAVPDGDASALRKSSDAAGATSTADTDKPSNGSVVRIKPSAKRQALVLLPG